MPLIIKWNRRALNELNTAIEYISKDSVQNGEKVKNKILDRINFIADHPESFPLDKFKVNNDNSFRAFELQRYRVSYRIFGNEIQIVGLRHTKRNPKFY